MKCKDKCVTVRDSDKILVLDECKGDTDTRQLFSYDKTQRTVSITSRQSLLYVESPAEYLVITESNVP